MNINIEFLKKKKKFTKGDSKLRPDLYWRYILLVTFVLITLSFVFGFFLFLDVTKDRDFSTISVNERDTLKKEKINSALLYFKERENKSNEILNSPSMVIDPSL
ncbi:MAG: hypothetical protein NDI62_00850 [Burkholderiales bacterium]|nr:hypothetical protein [Burkholderiales bacterium]